MVEGINVIEEVEFLGAAMEGKGRNIYSSKRNNWLKEANKKVAQVMGKIRKSYNKIRKNSEKHVFPGRTFLMPVFRPPGRENTWNPFPGAARRKILRITSARPDFLAYFLLDVSRFSACKLPHFNGFQKIIIDTVLPELSRSI